MKKLNFLTMAILVLSAFFLQNCRKDPSCKGVDQTPYTEFHNISEEDKSKIPFTGMDTLIYISDLGDTATLFGQGKKESYTLINGGNGNLDCPRIMKYYYEVVELEYEGINPELFAINNNINITENGSGITFKINSYPFGNPIKFFNNTYYYNDSTLINGKYYLGSLFQIQNTVMALYNYNYGFIKLQFIGGKTWRLKIN